MLGVWDGNAIKLGCDDCCTSINVIKKVIREAFEIIAKKKNLSPVRWAKLNFPFLYQRALKGGNVMKNKRGLCKVKRMQMQMKHSHSSSLHSV